MLFANTTQGLLSSFVIWRQKRNHQATMLISIDSRLLASFHKKNLITYRTDKLRQAIA